MKIRAGPEKSQKIKDSHRNEVSQLTHSLNYRSVYNSVYLTNEESQHRKH